MKIRCLLSIGLLVLPLGCRNVGHDLQPCGVKVTNRSLTPIRHVTLDPDGRKTGFGFLAPKGRGKTTAGYSLVVDRNVVIEWEEEGKLRRCVLDVSRYATTRNHNGDVNLLYLGNGKWSLVGR